MANKAVLIGVNRYKIPGADLRGCVNDVKNLQSVLSQYYGFGGGDMVTLLDDKATKKSIQAAIKQTVGGAKKGDVVLLHFSGHGSNVPDNDGDEADNRDEILCPHDLDWRDPLTDDWLRATFDKMRDGVSLTVIFDCCHSGSATRAVLPPDAPIIPRYLPSPWDLVAAESGRKLRGTVRATVHGASRAARKKSDVVTADIEEILVSGCRDTQTSADARIGGSFNGALTYNLVAAIKEAKGQLSYRDLHTKVLARLKAGGYDQVPQLEGRKRRFEAQFLSPLA
jgi:hypothetical protein